MLGCKPKHFEYNITLLLNCLLGLIVLPSEYYKRKSRIFFEKDTSEFNELTELLDNATFNPTKKKNKSWIEDKKSLKNLIKKVRNGVSHQQIECVGNNGKWQSVVLRDINTYNQNNIELEVTWTTKQLKTFALFVADSYLIEINKIENKKKAK
jgi:HEPN pEK499 p136